MHIYHIVLPDDWAAFDTDLYRAKSLETEGFIHCSFSDQLNGVIQRHYSREPQVVVLDRQRDLSPYLRPHKSRGYRERETYADEIDASCYPHPSVFICDFEVARARNFRRNSQAEFRRGQTPRLDRSRTLAAAYRRDHGRQRPMGKAPRQATHIRPSRRSYFGSLDHRTLSSSRDRRGHALRLLDRELHTPACRG